MPDTPRAARRAVRLLFGVAPFCLLLPTMAQAQSYSPGGLMSSALPSVSGPLQGNAPPFQFSASGDLSERYTDNALGSSFNTEPGYDSRGELSVVAAAATSSLDASLHYTLDADYFATTPSDTVISNRLEGNGTMQVLPDHLLLSASVFASPVYSNQLGNIAPIGETLPAGGNSNLLDTYGFTVQPDFTFRLGDFLRSDLLPSYNSIYIEQALGSGSTIPLNAGLAEHNFTEGLTERLTSGDDFSRLQWSAIGSYSQMGRTTGGLTQRSATGELSYDITHEIAIVADGGYQTVKAIIPLNKAYSGPTYFAGLKFNGAKLTGDIRVGEQYRGFSVVGSINYQITPIVSFVASATDTVTTPSSALLDPNSALSNILRAVQSGQIVLPASGLGSLADLTTQSIGLQNSIARIRADSVGFVYSLDGIAAQLTGFITSQDTATAVAAGQNQDLKTEGVDANLSYPFNDILRGSADVSYLDQTLQIGSAQIMQYSAEGEYSLTDRTSLYVAGSYLRRLSNNALAAVSVDSGDVSIASVRVGIRHQF